VNGVEVEPLFALIEAPPRTKPHGAGFRKKVIFDERPRPTPTLDQREPSQLKCCPRGPGWTSPDTGHDIALATARREITERLKALHTAELDKAQAEVARAEGGGPRRGCTELAAARTGDVERLVV